MKDIYFKNKNFIWVNLYKTNSEEIKDTLNEFNLPEPVVNLSMHMKHLPKFERFENVDFFLIRSFLKEKTEKNYVIKEFTQKMKIFVADNFLITIHNKKSKVLNKIKEDFNDTDHPPKITSSRELLHKIIREVLKTYDKPADKVADIIEQHENTLFQDNVAVKESLKQLYQLKRESLACVKVLNQTRDVLNEYSAVLPNRHKIKELQELNASYLHLHTQNKEEVQNLSDLSISLSDLRLNEIMKILTIFSAFFLPLSFVAGVYGMNFTDMPELSYKWGYLGVLILMILIAVIIYFWFKKKNFL